MANARPSDNARYPIRTYGRNDHVSIFRLTGATGGSPAVSKNDGTVLTSTSDAEGSFQIGLGIRGTVVFFEANLKSTTDVELDLDSVTNDGSGSANLTLNLTGKLAGSADDLDGIVCDCVLIVQRATPSGPDIASTAR